MKEQDHLNKPIIDLLSLGTQKLKQLLEQKGTETPAESDSNEAFDVDAEAAANQVRPRFALWFEEQIHVRAGEITGYLASAHDANTRLVTVSIAQLVRVGLLQRDHGLVQGDQLATAIDGRLVIWKVNRRNGQTLAAHFPVGLELPAVVDGVFQRVSYRVTVLGPLKTAQVVCHLSDSPMILNHTL